MHLSTKPWQHAVRSEQLPEVFIAAYGVRAGEWRRSIKNSSGYPSWIRLTIVALCGTLERKLTAQGPKTTVRNCRISAQGPKATVRNCRISNAFCRRGISRDSTRRCLQEMRNSTRYDFERNHSVLSIAHVVGANTGFCKPLSDQIPACHPSEVCTSFDFKFASRNLDNQVSIKYGGLDALSFRAWSMRYTWLPAPRQVHSTCMLRIFANFFIVVKITENNYAASMLFLFACSPFALPSCV